jgi:nucleoside diphosphate kinase
MSRTLILVKPDAFERNLTGEVIARFERKGLKIAATSSRAVRWSRSCSRAPTPSPRRAR